MKTIRRLISWWLTLVWVIGLGPIFWILRDGLGPDAVESHGMEAITRFLVTFYWGPIGLLLSLWTAWEWRTPTPPKSGC